MKKLRDLKDNLYQETPLPFPTEKGSRSVRLKLGSALLVFRKHLKYKSTVHLRLNVFIDSGPLWEGYHESRRCSRDTYPESHITKYTTYTKINEERNLP